MATVGRPRPEAPDAGRCDPPPSRVGKGEIVRPNRQEHLGCFAGLQSHPVKVEQQVLWRAGCESRLDGERRRGKEEDGVGGGGGAVVAERDGGAANETRSAARDQPRRLVANGREGPCLEADHGRRGRHLCVREALAKVEDGHAGEEAVRPAGRALAGAHAHVGYAHSPREVLRVPRHRQTARRAGDAEQGVGDGRAARLPRVATPENGTDVRVGLG
mmetsp:Transcript_18267/g.59780  ORF Transcript_18267/g.59780 Transcript_18267/m.59780 type:complete len:217 (+) Transcript_18267:476-1126(+)